MMMTNNVVLFSLSIVVMIPRGTTQHIIDNPLDERDTDFSVCDEVGDIDTPNNLTTTHIVLTTATMTLTTMDK
jgi:hypothetical protein